MKKEINVYYHVCLVNDGLMMAMEQLHLLAVSGLMYSANSINIGIRYDGENILNKNYLFRVLDGYNIRGNINILYCQDNSFDNCGELSTSIFFKKYADSLVDRDSYILYFHTKGVSRFETPIELQMKYWRNFMEHFMIMRWKDCISKLDDGYESCGTIKCDMTYMNRTNNIHRDNPDRKDLLGEDYLNRYYYPGTFYWINTSVIKRIPIEYFYSDNEYKLHSVEALPGLIEHKQFWFSDIDTEKTNPYTGFLINPVSYLSL
jgi:hypothetical protein